MIYQIYINCHDDTYQPAHFSHPTYREESCTFRGKTKQLLPYRVPQDHYNQKRLSHSLHQLNHQVKDNKQNNTYLATKILFSHGKQQTRKFLHRAKQLFGNKNHPLKKDKIKASTTNSVHDSKQSSPIKKDELRNSLKQQLYFETFKPDFRMISKRQPPQLRQQRRKTFGIQEPEILNYQNTKRGLPKVHFRKKIKVEQQKNKFIKINTKGVTAKISTNLEARHKVTTRYLAKLMNLNVQCLGVNSLRKRCA